MFFGVCKEGYRVSDSRSRSVVERKNEWMVFLYRRPESVQNSDEEHLPERAHSVDIVSAVSQRNAGSLRSGEDHSRGAPTTFEIS